MRVLQEIDRRPSFHEEQNLSGFLDRSEFRDGLFRTVIECVKALALQAFDKFSMSIRDDAADIHAFDADANALCRHSGLFRSLRGGFVNEQGLGKAREEQENWRESVVRAFSPATRQNALPCRLSRMLRSWCADGGETLPG